MKSKLEMKYKDLVELYNSLHDLYNSGKEISVRTNLKINKDIDEVQKNMGPYNKTRDGIIAKYSNGKGSVGENDENWEPCAKDINELGEENVNVEIEKINLSELEKIDLLLPTVHGLMKIIVEDEEGGDGNG